MTENIIGENFYSDVKTLQNVEFLSIKKSDKNGFAWQHGVCLTRFDGKFYATWGRNKGQENSAGEQTVVFVSDDAHSWTEQVSFAAEEGGFGYSHGVLYEKNERLFLFVPHFAGSDNQSPTGIRFRNLSTHVFFMNKTSVWSKTSAVIPDFWPLQIPIKMANGNYIMSGIDTMWRVAIAISNGEDFTAWKVIKPPYNSEGFTESNVIVRENVMDLYIREEFPSTPNDFRCGISCSTDFGETWSPITETDMCMSNSKPSTGTLSDKTEYLIANTLYGCGKSRLNLTIALGKNGKFNRQFIIRSSEIPDALKEIYAEKTNAQPVSYPSAYEFDGKLFITYSSDMTGGNRNNIELAIIDINSLK